MMLSHLRGGFLIIWIPAFAGMTRFSLMDDLNQIDGDPPRNHNPAHKISDCLT